jgi:hypothetical protein
MIFVPGKAKLCKAQGGGDGVAFGKKFPTI